LAVLLDGSIPPNFSSNWTGASGLVVALTVCFVSVTCLEAYALGATTGATFSLLWEAFARQINSLATALTFSDLNFTSSTINWWGHSKPWFEI
jgi:hypothetical protein